MTQPVPMEVHVEGLGTVPATVAEEGAGRPVLLLHGGAGPRSVAGFGGLLAAAHPVRVFTPVHPGFDGTPRPGALDSVGLLAALYEALLDALDLTDVTVVGSSIGGWIAAELALRGSSRVGRVVLLDAVGIEVPGHPVADVFGLTMDEIADLSYHEPDRFRLDVAALPPAQAALLAGNRAALAVYAGAMTDPGLRARLAAVRVPAVVVWGEADRIADAGYGHALAAAIPGARFVLLPRAGHMPQLEAPDALLAVLGDVLAGAAAGARTEAG